MTAGWKKATEGRRGWTTEGQWRDCGHQRGRKTAIAPRRERSASISGIPRYLGQGDLMAAGQSQKAGPREECIEN